jgi:hypothetical protein
MERQRDVGALIAAIAFLVAGILAVHNSEASWFGMVEVSGRQAQLFGWASIAFASVIFLVYLRGTKGQ